MSQGEGGRGPGAVPWHPAHLVPAALAAVAGLAVVLATQRHGLDWTDESFVWVMIASNRVAVGEAWGFQHLLHPVWVAVGERVLPMRLLRVVGYLVMSGILTWAAARVLGASGVDLRRRERWFVLLVAQTGTLLAFSYPPRYLGYNELSAWTSALLCAVLAVGLVPRRDDGPLARTLPWATAGLLLPPLVVAKFTAGLAWLPVVAVLLVVAVPGTPQWRRLVAVLAGLVTGAVGLLFTGVPAVAVARNAVRLLGDGSAQAASDHSVSTILETYLDSTVLTGRALAIPVLLFLVLVLLCARTPRPRVAAAVAGLAVAGALAARLTWPWAVAGDWDGLGVVTAALGLCGAAAVLAGPATLPPSAPRPRPLLVLLVTPLLAAVGTNNAIWAHTIFSATAWAVLTGVALCLLARAAPAPVRTAPLLLGGLLVAVAATAVAYDVTVHPYRSTPYLAQTTPTTVPALAGLRLSADQAATADWLRSVAQEQGAADLPAVALHSPGHLLALNASGWASPWRGGSWEASVGQACADAPPRDLLVVEPAEPAARVAVERDRLVSALDGCGLAFPDDVAAVAERDGTTVWRLPPGGGG
ncbi:hypothetical protein [Ornithinimicrobium cerasi]|uniref:4-amino-4-deoxy-L-arabinose transferase n=1 Tax=Ornithinimicrobium cerasi TaxID=2248773 RepID=A0A285VW70_9MICO|nr:hypothetical protein [Ornithinimicrobium cerasi]SOC57838.1 hypothetical protein SAMN05421879_11724 [Ornithinimicrobium cerasi]SOC57999.1 hypothetical protein SAMN05421879_12013 [Ornithinimicrobium cerasi]